MPCKNNHTLMLCQESAHLRCRSSIRILAAGLELLQRLCPAAAWASSAGHARLPRNALQVCPMQQATVCGWP